MSFFLMTLNTVITSSSVPDWFTDRTVLNLRGNQIVGEPGGLLVRVICLCSFISWQRPGSSSGGLPVIKKTALSFFTAHRDWVMMRGRKMFFMIQIPALSFTGNNAVII